MLRDTVRPIPLAFSGASFMNDGPTAPGTRTAALTTSTSSLPTAWQGLTGLPRRSLACNALRELGVFPCFWIFSQIPAVSGRSLFALPGNQKGLLEDVGTRRRHLEDM